MSFFLPYLYSSFFFFFPFSDKRDNLRQFDFNIKKFTAMSEEVEDDDSDMFFI